MSNPRSITDVVVALASSVLLVVITVACARDACRDIGAPSCAAPRFAPPYSGVDPCSPEAVLTSAATAMFSYRPGEQPDTAAAFAAATPLISTAYIERIGVSASVLAPVTNATWAHWTSQHVVVTAAARIALDDHPPDTTTQVSRVVAVTQHPGDEAPRALTAYIQAATRDSTTQPWLVTDLEVK